MLARRGFRYRIYPTPAQAARLRQWEGALRVLWNLAHEQRLAYLRRHAKLPSAFDQINELTQLRTAVPWMADVPRNVSAQLLVDLDSAWQRCFSRLGHRPRWKKKGRDVISYKLAATGGTLVEVQAHYSSQTCPACGVVDAASRFGEVFCCVACGHRAHADLNAAQVLLSRRNGGDAGRGGYGDVRRPVKRQLRVVRRGHSTEHRLGLPKSPGLQSG